MSLPNRSYVSQKVIAVMREGVEFTPTSVWYDLTPVVQMILVDAYGGDHNAKRAVLRCIQNMSALNGNPTKIRGRGVGATYIWNYETDKAKRKDVVFTTETPDEPIPEMVVKVGPYDIPEKPQTYVSVEGLVAAESPQVGDTKTYTLIGKFLDGTYLWRESETDHVGSIEFTAL
jgi:hypothetical protein